MAESTMDAAQKSMVERAAALVTEAMDLLDASGAAPVAAAHLAMAQQKLLDVLTIAAVKT